MKVAQSESRAGWTEGCQREPNQSLRRARNRRGRQDQNGALWALVSTAETICYDGPRLLRREGVKQLQAWLETADAIKKQLTNVLATNAAPAESAALSSTESSVTASSTPPQAQPPPKDK